MLAAYPLDETFIAYQMTALYRSGRLGDALGLSARVDAMLVVVRLNQIKRTELKELSRMLDAAIAPKLGFVVTGADEEPDYGYTGYATYYLDQPREGRV